MPSLPASSARHSAVQVGVAHGRFQILHYDHLRYLLAAADACRHLVVGITNPDPTLTRPDPACPARSEASSNPLTYYERYQLVRVALPEAGVPLERFSIVPFPVNMPELARYYVPFDAVFFLTIYDDWGREKLRKLRELGLATRVLWERPLDEKGIEASSVRRLMAAGGDWERLVPPSVAQLLTEWQIPERLAGSPAEV